MNPLDGNARCRLKVFVETVVFRSSTTKSIKSNSLKNCGLGMLPGRYEVAISTHCVPKLRVPNTSCVVSHVAAQHHHDLSMRYNIAQHAERLHIERLVAVHLLSSVAVYVVEI